MPLETNERTSEPANDSNEWWGEWRDSCENENCETLCKLFNQNANSTYCMIYGQPRWFSDLVPWQAVTKCTFVMYIIKLIVVFFFRSSFVVCMYVNVSLSVSLSISMPVFLGFKHFFSLFGWFSCFVSFHQHNLRLFLVSMCNLNILHAFRTGLLDPAIE